MPKHTKGKCCGNCKHFKVFYACGHWHSNYCDIDNEDTCETSLCEEFDDDGY